jgi:dephospho-CoA kinase
MPLIVLSGPPGSGKTTLAHALAARRAAAVVIERDNFLGFIRAGRLLPWLPEAGAQNAIAWRAAVRTAMTYLPRYEVILEGCIDAADLELVRRAHRGFDGVLHFVALWPTREIAVERAFARERNQRLQISTDRYAQMHDELAARTADVGARIDTSHLTIDETVGRVESAIQEGRSLLLSR